MPSKQQVQLEARKEHARELRKAHFHLGFEKGIQKETESQYQEDYKAYNLEAAQKTKDEMQKLQKDLRSNHYILGTDNDASKIFISTAAQSFQQPKNPQISQLSLETKNDLRSHHFNLGYSKDPEISDYKINYDPKQINLDVLKDKKEQINMLRKHNHDFGDNKDYYSSIYNENFSKTYDPQYLKQGKSKQEILEQIIELRKTNLSMGNNNPQYTSEAMAEFNVKPSACRALMDQNLKKTNFVLGDDKDLFHTIFKDNFKGEQLSQHDPNKIKALSKDLRSAHFTLGNDPRAFLSEAHRNFVQPGKDVLNQATDMSYLYKNHFNLEGFGGTDPTKHYVSDYKNNFGKKELEKNAKIRDEKADRKSNIVLGSDQIEDQFKSEAQKNFIDFGRQNRTALEQQALNDLRTHHYQFGTDPQNMISEAKDTFVDKSKIANQSKLDQELIKDLRKNHFEYGTSKGEYSTTMQDIGKYQGPPSKLDPVLAKDLRSHHFCEQDNHQYYNTTYRIDFVDPEGV